MEVKICFFFFKMTKIEIVSLRVASRSLDNTEQTHRHRAVGGLRMTNSVPTPLDFQEDRWIDNGLYIDRSRKE